MSEAETSTRGLLAQTQRVSAEVSDRVLTTHPLPVADALAALLAADSAFELRDRIVEVFRVQLRLLAAIVLAARLQFGAGKGGDVGQVPELLRSLRGRGLTDGQWVALLREMLRPWSAAGEGAGHPLPELVTLVHARKSELTKLFDELLVMRKSETVAHGATGTRAGIEEILDKRAPQLVRTLELLDPLWARTRLCVPLAQPGEGEAQWAWLLAGSTPPRGRFRKMELSAAARMPPKELALVGRDGTPLVALHPILLFMRPSPDSVEELFLLDGGTKRGALFVAFPSMSEHRETSAWSALESVLSDEEPGPESGAHGAHDRPYRGLASFGPEDAALFFGREEQAEAIANRVRRNGLLTVTGPSGSGKTSLLRAGVLPLFSDLLTTFLRPGSDPLTSLASKLSESTGFERTELRALAHADPQSLAARVAGHARAAGKLHLIIVDQGEEMLTLCADADARERFGAALVALASDDGSTRVVLSVREDFFGRLATVHALRELYSRHVEVVTTPDRLALIRTLIAPALAFGYSFEDEELVTSMVDSVSEAPAALALLQFCADRLWDQRDRKWKRLTSDAYRSLGGVAGALAAHADKILSSMSAPERTTCRALFLRLVSGERTRAVITRSELLDGLRDAAEGARVLDSLIGARLVAVTDDASGQATVEIVHEALIKHWGALDRWLGEDEEGQRLGHAMRQAAREWSARKRPRDLVWRGDLLEELRRHRRRSLSSLAGVELAFAEASEIEARRGRRLRVGLVAAALLSTTTFSIFALWQWRSTEAARLEADRQRSATAHEKQNVEIRGLVAEARGHEPTGRSGHALALLRAASQLEQEQGATTSTLLSLELERLQRAGAGGRVLSGHSSGVYRVCLPPGRDRVVTSSFDETTRVWELSTGRLLHTIPSQGHVVRALACSPDGSLVALGSSDARSEKGTLSLWDLESGARVRAFEDLPKPVTTAEFKAGGKQLVVFGQDSIVRRYEVGTGAALASIEDASGWIMDFDVSADGERFVTTDGEEVKLWAAGESAPRSSYKVSSRIAMIAISDDGSRAAWPALDGGVTTLFDLVTGQTIKELKPSGTLGVAHLQFAPGGRVLVTSGPRGVHLWDARTGANLRQLRTDPQQSSFEIAPDGERILTRRSSHSAELWDVQTGARLAGFTGHDAQLEDFAISEDGHTIVSASYDKTARIYDVRSTALRHAWGTEHERITAFDTSADGRFLAASSRGGPVRVFATGGEGLAPPAVATLAGLGEARQLAFAPDGPRLLAGFTEGVVKIVELPGAAELASVALGEPFACGAWSVDGQRFAVGTSKGAVRIFSADGKPLTAIAAGASAISQIVFAPGGEWLAYSSYDRQVRIARTATAELVGQAESTAGVATDLAFSPDGRSLVIADSERVRWLDVETRDARELRDHDQATVAVAFSPDGATLATASADRTILLYGSDAAPPRALLGHSAAVVDVSFSADGLRLLSASDDGSTRVWDLTLGAALDVMEPIGVGVAGARYIAGDQIAVFGGGSVAVVASAGADRTRSLQQTGALTNLRVCRSSFALLALAPPPAPHSVWAPDEACLTAR